MGVKISGMAAAATLTGAEALEVTQAGSTKNVLLSTILTWVKSAIFGTANTFTKTQSVTPVTNNAVTGSITPNAAASNNFEYTLIGNTTVANPTSVVPGTVLNFALLQDGVGGRTVSLGANFVLRAGDTFASAAGAMSLMSCYCHSNGKLYASVRTD